MPWFMFSKGSGGEQVLLEVLVMMIVIVVLVMRIEQRAFLGTIVSVQVTGDVDFDLHGGHQKGSESRYFCMQNQQDPLKDWRKGVREGMRKISNDSGNDVINDAI